MIYTISCLPGGRRGDINRRIKRNCSRISRKYSGCQLRNTPSGFETFKLRETIEDFIVRFET
jgi:hypothetical protein